MNVAHNHLDQDVRPLTNCCSCNVSSHLSIGNSLEMSYTGNKLHHAKAHTCAAICTSTLSTENCKPTLYDSSGTAVKSTSQHTGKQENQPADKKTTKLGTHTAAEALQTAYKICKQLADLQTHACSAVRLSPGTTCLTTPHLTCSLCHSSISYCFTFLTLMACSDLPKLLATACRRRWLHLTGFCKLEVHCCYGILEGQGQ